MLTHTLGFPRIGPKRELKKALEAYWRGRCGREDLLDAGRRIRHHNWSVQKEAGIDLIPSNDFSFYDHVLDTSLLVGNIPERFDWDGKAAGLDLAFRIARGVTSGSRGEPCGCGRVAGVAAAEMTKWFDTNYHYIVPELDPATRFSLSSSKPFDEFDEARRLGFVTKPVLLGPVTYLLLGKVRGESGDGFDRLRLLDRLVPVYEEILVRLRDQGAEWVQLDEPAFSLDLSAVEQRALIRTYEALSGAAPGLDLMVATYFGRLGANRETFLSLPVDALHVDAVRAPTELDSILADFPDNKRLSLGVVDGRNVWRNDYSVTLQRLWQAADALGRERLLVAPSCSLLHVPVSLREESALNPELASWLAFAEEKLREVAELRNESVGQGNPEGLRANAAALESRRNSSRTKNPKVRERMSGIRPEDFRRLSGFADRRSCQREKLQLPAFPTTTIGSFPQTQEVRTARASWRRGEIATDDYERFLQDETAKAVHFQEEIGLDVLVHGEFERNDMVEYFGEQLDGFAFMRYGWVQSYGSRCVKPPIIFGDVSRPKPMTVGWTSYAQSLTRRPLKGMLTGPVTILQWSFVRDDQPRRDTALQIALALRDEVLDLERSGARIIQIDEAALREGLPLRREDWADYLTWAVDAFRLTASGVRDETQIHTHMCYAEFNDIVEAIGALDADVITIEASRSGMELLNAFVEYRYPNEIGPGIYDIHSPRVPSVDEMVTLAQKALQVLPKENFWVNPDCGLKTRGWIEVKAALANMVAAARQLRRDGCNRGRPGGDSTLSG